MKKKFDKDLMEALIKSTKAELCEIAIDAQKKQFDNITEHPFHHIRNVVIRADFIANGEYVDIRKINDLMRAKSKTQLWAAEKRATIRRVRQTPKEHLVNIIYNIIKGEDSE